MSTIEPIRLEIMQAGTTADPVVDTRGLDLAPALSIENDTVATILGIDIVRSDGKTIVAGDLVISPTGFAAPWIGPNLDTPPKSDTVVNWWQKAVELQYPLDIQGNVQYLLTIRFATTAGRLLRRDVFQTVAP